MIRFAWATKTLHGYGWYMALAAAFLIPIKLTLGYFVLFPLVFLWLLGGDLRIVQHPIVWRLLLFALVAALSGILGIAPLRTLTSCARLTLSLLAIPAVAAVTRNRVHLLLAAIAGQTIPAIVSCLELGALIVFPRYFTGPVTESGQLAIIIPLTAALLLSSGLITNKAKGSVLLSFTVMSLALFLNAKRGPLIACFVGLSVLCLVKSPRLLVPLALSYVGLGLAMPTLHQRLAASAEHFFIAGGRNEMWSIGAELISRYPLGIGLHNSPYLRHFSVEVPPEHSHFHSNIINILVETGWLGLSVFAVWFVTTNIFAYRARHSDQLALGLMAALVSWQVAGLVEYNIGDSEVFVLMLIQVGGVLAALIDKSAATSPQSLQPTRPRTAASTASSSA